MKSLLAFIAVVGVLISWWHTPEDSSASMQSIEEARTVVTPQLIDTYNNPFVAIAQPAQQVLLSASTNTSADALDHPVVTVCENNCAQVHEFISSRLRVSDLELEKLLSYTDDLAAYLRGRPDLRLELIDLAAHASGDKRTIIIAAFTQLDADSRLALGNALLQSPRMQQRLDGVHLLASPETMDKSLVQPFSELLKTERDIYVRGSLVKALNQDKFYRDQEVLDVLSHVVYSDNDDTVRGEALLAITRLSGNSDAGFRDSLTAVRSHLSEYQSYGVQALDEIIARQRSSGAEISQENAYQLEMLHAEIMSPEYDNMPLQVRANLDDLYDRYF